jgi:hypothetical protein
VKLKSAGKHAAALGRCRAKAIGKGTPIDPACAAKADGKTGPAFQNAEAKTDCIAPNGDAEAISAKDAALVDHLDLAVNGAAGGPSKCDAKKLQAGTKKAAEKAGCHAKAVRKGVPVDGACLGKAEAKFSAAIGKAETRTDCTNTGQAAVLEAIVDAYVTDLVSELTTATPNCCAPARIELSTSGGSLNVGPFTFPFPSGAVIRIDTDAGDASCKHGAVVPAGGFTVPLFCIPNLQWTSEFIATGCESGTGRGSGTVWDGMALCPDADVSSVGDTSDPSTNTCGTLGTGCGTYPGEAGFDTASNIDTTRGDGLCDAAGVGVQLAIPFRSHTWNDENAECPDPDGIQDGNDSYIADFTGVLYLTTGRANADYTDLNGDACSFAGSGPDHTKRCSLDNSRPCNFGTCSNPSAGTCQDGPVVGVAPPGPCCGLGQASTLVASGIASSSAALPIVDIIYSMRMATTVTGCGTPAGDTCTPTTNVCLQ